MNSTTSFQVVFIRIIRAIRGQPLPAHSKAGRQLTTNDTNNTNGKTAPSAVRQENFWL
ncbi:MAG: hypothetical protein ACK5N9_00300 [Pirellula sp.]